MSAYLSNTAQIPCNSVISVTVMTKRFKARIELMQFLTVERNLIGLLISQSWRLFRVQNRAVDFYREKAKSDRGLMKKIHAVLIFIKCIWFIGKSLRVKSNDTLLTLIFWPLRFFVANWCVKIYPSECTFSLSEPI